MDINQKITEELGVKRWQVDAAVKSLSYGRPSIIDIPGVANVIAGLIDHQIIKEKILVVSQLFRHFFQIVPTKVLGNLCKNTVTGFRNSPIEIQFSVHSAARAGYPTVLSVIDFTRAGICFAGRSDSSEI